MTAEELEREELRQRFQKFFTDRAERGGPGAKKAEGIAKEFRAVSGYEELRTATRRAWVYPQKYLTEEENNTFEGIVKGCEFIREWVEDLTGADESDKKHALTLEDFEDYCETEGIRLRYNVITREYENGGKDPRDLVTVAYSNLVNRFTKVSKDVIEDYIHHISRRNRYNPVMDRIASIRWDGQDRIEELCDIMRISADDEFSRKLVKKWLCQAIRLAENELSEGLQGAGVLVLVGAQGAGKSTLAKKLAFSDPSLICDKQLQPDNRDSVSRITSAWIAELAELGQLFRKSDNDSVKAFLTYTTDQFRAPYDRADSTYPRRTSFIATLNPADDDARYITDTTGSRRWWTVRCNTATAKRFDFEAENRLDFAQLWRQAYEIVSKDPSASELTVAELAELALKNREFEMMVPAEEELLDILAMAGQTDRDGHKRFKECKMNSSEIKGAYEVLKPYTVKKIAKALRHIGRAPDRLRRYDFVAPNYRAATVFQEAETEKKA